MKEPISNTPKPINNTLNNAKERAILRQYCDTVRNFWTSKLGPNWYQQNFSFHRNIWLSCAQITTDILEHDPATEWSIEDKGKLAEATRITWFCGMSQVLEGLLMSHNGEYDIIHLNVLIEQYITFWTMEVKVDADHTTLDTIEAIVVDACASHQINVTAVKSWCDSLNLNLQDLCVVPLSFNIKVLK